MGRGWGGVCSQVCPLYIFQKFGLGRPISGGACQNAVLSRGGKAGGGESSWAGHGVVFLDDVIQPLQAGGGGREVAGRRVSEGREESGG